MYECTMYLLPTLKGCDYNISLFILYLPTLDNHYYWVLTINYYVIKYP